MRRASPPRRRNLRCGELASVWLVGGLLLGCAAAESPLRSLRPLSEARVAVEVWPGFTQRAGASRSRATHVEILIDYSTSMRARTAGGPPRYAAARSAALRLARELSPDVSVGVSALGVTKGEEDCAGPLRLTSTRGGENTRAVEPMLATLKPQSEASLAGALDTVRRKLAPEMQRTRVVLLSDLGAECGGDLCASAEALVAVGARLDLVLLSDAVVPQCFAQLTPEGEPRLAQTLPAEPTAGFRVRAHQTGSAAVGDVLARGRTDGVPIATDPGAVTIFLEMDPPSVIGPLVLERGTLTRVRVLDFATLDPPVREWRWDVLPLGEDTAAP